MQSRLLNALAALALMLPMAGHAAEFGYSFVDLAIIPEAEIESGDFDVDGDGFQLRGSLAVAQNYFALVEIEDIEFDADNGNDVDFTRWLVGAGAHWPINQTLDFVARGGLVRYDISYGRSDDDDIGFFLGGRVRAQVIQNLEVEGGVDLTSAEVAGFEDEVTLVGEGRYQFTSQFSAGGLIKLGDDSSEAGIYGRYNF
jgi:hypothetical protein